ncbi:hypothetical protein GW17_00052580 [Ensete ventricosum]|nr:hypothetical protein GW17_00052580 [Ensete ventricosum]
MIVFIWLIKYVVAVVKVMNLIGDVKGKVAVMVDDMIDTAGKPFLFVVIIYVDDQISSSMNLGTIAKGAALLHQEGAREVYACSTHAVFRYLPILIFEQHYFLDSEIVGYEPYSSLDID